MSTITNIPRPTLCVLDSDRSLTDHYRSLADRLGLKLQIYDHPAQVQHGLLPESTACLVASVHQGESQVVDDLQQVFTQRLHLLNIIALDRSLVSAACALVGPGTVSLMTTPIDFERLEAWLSFCVQRYHTQLDLRQKREDFDQKRSSLTDRQRQILNLISHSVPNKSIAANLGVSQRTVETDRAIVFKTFEADTAIDLAIRIGEARLLNALEDRRSEETSPWSRQTQLQS